MAANGGERAPRTAKRAPGDPSRLSWGALQGAPTAFAVVEGKQLAAGNGCYVQLARVNASAIWKRVGSDVPNHQRACRSLTRLLLREVATLAEVRTEPVTRVYRRVGHEQYLEASYWRSPADKTKTTVVMIHEATSRVCADQELARMREALVQNSRMRAIGELASGVAHDLNNTLHAMHLRLSLIEQNEACRSVQGSNIAALSRAINDAALVVDRLQDFARQKTEQTLDLVNLSAVVGEAVEMVRTSIEGETSLAGKPVRIRAELPSLPAVTALASELRHVVVNLLLNARDAMSKGGTIEVVGQERGTRVILQVRDEGCGVPRKDL
ncbi:MAG TPA: ATP-binding protein, partial [Polyangiaceae bacterium]|nr:ATP-binding protein [Polyangiaceae bacterium]